ncbi:MAG: hypothetical protein IJ588_02850, partial [Prevotella sp.]|nr:hypothetical protein [Prevotella sp.]
TNYTGTAKAKFLIKGTSLDNAVVTVDGVAVSGTELTGTYVYAGGAAIKPVVSTVKIGESTTLNPSTDYDVTYENNKLATANAANTNGKAKIVITGKGDYLNNTKVIEFTIAQKDLATAGTEVVVNGVNASYEFKNAAWKPSVTNVQYTVGETTYTLDKKSGSSDTEYDYDVTYGSNNTNVTTESTKGAVNIVAKAGGNYTGTKVVNFEITSKSIAEFYFDGTINAAQEYKGAKIEPATANNVKWTSSGAKLTENTDYTVVYGDATHDNKTVSASANDADKTGKITITGKGNYTGTKILLFQITKKALTIKAKNCEKTIGTADPTFELEYTGLVGEDILAGTTATPAAGVISGVTVSRTDGEDAGVKTLTVNTDAATGTAVTNYTLTADNNGTLTIKASTTPLVLKVKNPTAQTYGSVTFDIASMNGTGDAAAINLAKAGNLDVVSGWIGSNATPTAADLDAALNLSAVTFKYEDTEISGNPTNAGTYNIVTTGTATSNSYTNVQIQGGSFTIKPFTVVVAAQAPTAVNFVDGKTEYTTPTAEQIAAAGFDDANTWVKLYNTEEYTSETTPLTTTDMPQVSNAAEFWKKDFIKSIDWVYDGDHATLGDGGKIVITLNDEFISTNANANTNYTVKAVDAKVTFQGVLASYTFSATDAENTSKLTELANVTSTVKISGRSLKKGEWNAIVLPFDIKPLDFCKAIDGYAVFDVLENSGEKMNFKITINQIDAYTPFLVKTDKDVTSGDVSFTNAKIQAVNNENLVQQNDKWKFIGTVDYKEYQAPIWYTYVDANKPGKLLIDVWTDAHNMPGFYAYITSVSGQVEAEAPQIFVEEPDGTTTAISYISRDGVAVKAEGWYTINGVKLEGAPTQKGVYIQNGKKVILK